MVLILHTGHSGYREKYTKTERAYDAAFFDYGTGYSNLSRMISLPFEIIKIDKSIVQEAFRSDAMRLVLENTLNMIKKLNMQALAEGVETKEQADYLCRMGCDYIQGFYYSRPLDDSDFLRLVANNI